MDNNCSKLTQIQVIQQVTSKKYDLTNIYNDCRLTTPTCIESIVLFFRVLC